MPKEPISLRSRSTHLRSHAAQEQSTHSLCVRLPATLLTKVRRQCFRDGRLLQDFVREAIAQALEVAR
jgi:predicted DNA binding CopG/RHH family protein